MYCEKQNRVMKMENVGGHCLFSWWSREQRAGLGEEGCARQVSDACETT